MRPGPQTAADVHLKERRRLVLVVRETPPADHPAENMLALSRIGVTLLPPMPTFHNRPASVDGMIDHIVTRILDQLGPDSERVVRWEGPATARAGRPRSLTLAAAVGGDAAAGSKRRHRSGRAASESGTPSNTCITARYRCSAIHRRSSGNSAFD
ncbi:flavoprotein [Streptomyces sp. NPDC004752]